MRCLVVLRSPRHLVALIACSIVLAACHSNPTGTSSISGVANVRVLHASPDTPPIDVAIDDSAAFKSVAYGSASAYLSFKADSDTIIVRRTSDQSQLHTSGYTLVSGDAYTLAVYNTSASIGTQLFVDDTTIPPSGNAKLRVMHLAPSMGLVDLYLSSPGTDISAQSPIISQIPFPQATGYLPIITGTYDIRFTATGTKNIVLDIGNVTLGNGQNRTIVLLDKAGIGLPISAAILNDRD